MPRTASNLANTIWWRQLLRYLFIASGGSTPYDGSTAAKSLDTSKTAAFLTGTTATSVSCMDAGVAGQVFYLMATGGMGTGLTVVNSAACTNGSRIYISGGANIVSTGAATTANFSFIYDGTQWQLFSFQQ